MKLNLDTVRSEIQEYLAARGIAVFHGSPRSGEPAGAVYWDTEGHPDYREFLATAETAGVRVVTLYANEFTDDVIDDALGHLDASAVPREERRGIEARLREMRGFAGFTCQIELSFDLAPRTYVFDLRTEWFEDLSEMLDRVEGVFDEEEGDDDPLAGGYFSKN
jgi:hypothetical protein